MKLRGFLIALLSLVLSLCLVFPALGEYETLKQGSKGQAVLELKQRMYELGYFHSTNFSNLYNETTVERVKQLEKMNGLTQTGIATPELQQLIFSDDCIKADGTKAGSQSSPEQTASPEIPSINEISRDEDGFLSDESEEFVYEDEENGVWLYYSHNLQVEITAHEDTKDKIEWYETRVKTRNGEGLNAYLTDGKYLSPKDIALQNKAVVAFTDDFYCYRKRQKQVMGILIRNGQILSEKTKRPTTGGFPKLENMAYFADGSMKCYNAQDHTAQEYIEMGAVHVFAFGPILVTNGEAGEHMRDDTYYHYREPRCALGYIQPGKYLILTVFGRKSTSKGVYLSWLCDKMLENGVQEALNLDGGGTVQLVFMGHYLNGKNPSHRNTTSLLGFGTSDLVGQ